MKKILFLASCLICISCQQVKKIETSSSKEFFLSSLQTDLKSFESSVSFSQNTSSSETTSNSKFEDNKPTLKDEHYRKIAFAIVSSAENSTLNYNDNYAYIEDIGDGRGYTAGIIGFTTGTGDLIEVVKKYIALKPENNILEKYLTALEKVVGTASLEGLGINFKKDWEKACKDNEMIEAQNYIVETMYLNPAIKYAKEDNLSLLGQFIYYDALVMHGSGDKDDGESFEVILDETRREAFSPSKGGNEKIFLENFFEARKKMMLKEEAHEDLDRIEAQKKFLNEGKYNLELPLSWTMYGDEFTLTEKIIIDLN